MSLSSQVREEASAQRAVLAAMFSPTRITALPHRHPARQWDATLARALEDGIVDDAHRFARQYGFYLIERALWMRNPEGSDQSVIPRARIS